MTSLFDLLRDELPAFSAKVEWYLSELGIRDDIDGLSPDHIGLRIADPAVIGTLRGELDQVGSCISTATVNGREILLYQLREPLTVSTWDIPCVELPYPKPNHAYEDGWEHIEFVIPSDAATLEEMRASLMARFPQLNLKKYIESGQYEESLPSSEEDQLPNPSLIFEKTRGLGIKFHPRSIQEVVGYKA